MHIIFIYTYINIICMLFIIASCIIYSIYTHIYIHYYSYTTNTCITYTYTSFISTTCLGGKYYVSVHK